MSRDKDKITIDEVLDSIKVYIKDEESIELIKKTYEFSKEQHKNQYRKSGEPYIIHPLNVVLILTTIYADTPTLQAALLHDVLEDCDCTKEEMEEEFGSEVTKLVLGVTKLSKIHFSTENDYLIDYYKKIIVGLSEDVRVIIVKLADRLHNMRTLWALPEVKQKKISKESMEIFAPIADHLGIHKIKSELEDLSLRYLKPDFFYDVAEKLNESKVQRDMNVNDMLQEVTNLLTEHHINHDIKGRAKSIYSIYNNINKGKKFSDIYDLLALRILVDTEQDCYLALGIIHSRFRPLPKRFKDYIAMPKPNMYQSLHTTVFGIDGDLFEIQIRTYDMDEVAENGIASHWAYKEEKDAKESMQSATEQKLQFFKAIMELSNDKMSSEDFVNSVKADVLNKNIYAFTPKGDIIELPIGSTPIDFAYKVHTKVGETMIGAIVNNNIVPLDYELKNNDIVKINTNKASTPSKEWINIVKTTQARNKIKSFFTKSEREMYIDRGKESLEKALRKRKIAFNDFFIEDNQKMLFTKFNAVNLEELYLFIGNGKTSVNTIIGTIYKEEKQTILKNKEYKDKETDIIIEGIDKVKVSLANCCNPVYGDDIIGYITKGNGITIHRSICHNLVTLENRSVKATWNNEVKNIKYLTNLIVYSNSLENKMLDLIEKINTSNLSIEGINMISKTDVIVYEINLCVRDKEQIEKILLQLTKLKYVDKVERLIR